MDKLENLNSEQLQMLKEAFIKKVIQGLEKSLLLISLTGEKPIMLRREKCRLKKMAKLIKIVGILLQTKVYLFWQKSEVFN